jgi:hypothetical protein
MMATEVPQTPTTTTPATSGASTSSSTHAITQLLRGIQDPSEEESSQKCQKFIHLTNDQFTLLLSFFQQQQNTLKSLIHSSTSALGEHITSRRALQQCQV